MRRPREQAMRDEADATALWSIGTAVPAHHVSQEEALQFQFDYYQPEAAFARRLRFIYRRSHIEARYSCCVDMHKSALTPHIDKTPERSWHGPTIGQRMQVYEDQVVDLAALAAQCALQQQQAFKADDVTHLIVVTCTGFFAPGPELLLIERLSLRSDIRRLQIGFMGCHAALQGLQTADAICRSDERAVVLLVCAELCSLHFQYAPTEENLVVNSLFGDGAAAAIVSRAKHATARPSCHINYFTSQVYRDRQDTISWRIGDNGFRMGLALSNAKDLSSLVPAFVTAFLERHGWRQDDIALWAIHPGGRAILDVCERSLGLAPDALADSRAILRNYGNMSSPTILFIMAHLLASHPASSAQGIALAFGPGIALEGMLWHRRDGDGGLQSA